MNTFRAQHYEARALRVEGWDVRVASYQLGDRWVSKVDNVSPGAVIARGQGADRREAEEHAIAYAATKLRLTRRLLVPAEP